MRQFVAVEPFHHFLARMHDKVACHGHASQPVHRTRIELQCALVVELLQNVLLDLLDGSSGIDEVVVENFLQ